MKYPIYSTEVISPEKAQQMLLQNIGNRPIRKSTVKRYSDQMLKGKWHLTGEPIIFGKSGRLMNGQHRLSAVIMSGCKITFSIVRGIDDSSYLFIDQNTPKSVGDFLNMPDRTLMASVGKKILLLQKGSMANKSIKNAGYTTDEVVNFVENNIDVISKVARLGDRCYRHLNFMSKTEVGGVAGFLILFNNHSEELVENFFNELFFCTNGDKGVEMLRNRLLNDRLSRNSHMSSKAKYVIIAKTWNAWLKGEQKKQLRANLDEDITFD